jgi:rhomboid protease GluP
VEEIKKEPVTILLILLNALIFLIVEITGGSENGQHMLECGAVYAPLIFEQGQWYRMFTSMFLHFGAPHLINNMLVLFVLGQRLEPEEICSLCFLICRQKNTHYPQEHLVRYLQLWEE